jgi:hypothetical protein
MKKVVETHNFGHANPTFLNGGMTLGLETKVKTASRPTEPCRLKDFVQILTSQLTGEKS